MKIKGKVVEYDDFSGKIIGDDLKTYIVVSKDVIDLIKKGDLVSFESDKYFVGNKEQEVARFVKKLTNNK